MLTVVSICAIPKLIRNLRDIIHPTRLLVYGEFFRRHLAHKRLGRHLQIVLVQGPVTPDVVSLVYELMHV